MAIINNNRYFNNSTAFHAENLLPKDLWSEIFKNCHNKELKNLALVNKAFNKTINNNLTLIKSSVDPLSTVVALSRNILEITPQGNINVWDASIGKIVKIIPHTRPVIKFEYNKDFTVVLSSMKYFVYNSSDLTHLDTIKNKGFNQNLAIKNNLLYSANGDNVIEVIDMNTSQVKAQLRGHVDTILTYVVFKNMLVSTSADGALKFWNTNNNTLIESKKLGKEFTELTIEDGKLFGSFVTYTKGPQNTNSATAHKESLETPT